MTPVSSANFGFLVAYIIPGFVVVALASANWPMLQTWLGASVGATPTVGGFLYVTLASVAAGMTVNAARWLVLDPLHHYAGISRPTWDLSRLSGNLDGFEAFVEYHYRYYQFYGNMLVAMLVLTVERQAVLLLLPVSPIALGTAMALLMALFYLASRDALKKYYARTNALLNPKNSPRKLRNDERLPPTTPRFERPPRRVSDERSTRAETGSPEHW